MKTIHLEDIQAMDPDYRRTLVNKISGFKSAHLIGTKSASNVANVAIFNSVIHLGAQPPLLGFIMRPLTVQRHTYTNCMELGYFTLNAIGRSFHQKAHQTSAKYTEAVSEFEAVGLEAEYLADFPAPFVKESPLKMGLSFVEEHEIKANQTRLVVGQLEMLHVDMQFVKADGDIDLQAMDIISIGGLDSYYKMEKLGRYHYARPDQEVRSIV